jgi:hypothetical protein
MVDTMWITAHYWRETKTKMKKGPSTDAKFVLQKEKSRKQQKRQQDLSPLANVPKLRHRRNAIGRSAKQSFGCVAIENGQYEEYFFCVAFLDFCPTRRASRLRRIKRFA